MTQNLPSLVQQATQLAADLSFPLPSAPATGQFLAALAAAVPPGGAVLELGTGTGIGTGWIVHGLRGRTDATVITVEIEENLIRHVRQLPWPPWISLVAADSAAYVRGPGRYDLIFADSPGGKWEALDETIGSIRPSGVLLVDDMTPERFRDAEHKEKTAATRDKIMSHPDLVSVEIGWATGLIMSAKCHRQP